MLDSKSEHLFLQWSVYFKMYQAVKKNKKFVSYVDYDITISQDINCNCEDDIGEVFS